MKLTFDLRSDTVTQPSPAMLDAMSKAKTGDDLFGEDPTVRELELTSAQRFGFEDGLYTPTGTMSNQIAVMTHTRPGEAVVCADNAHIVLYEGGGCEANAGVHLLQVKTDEGLIPTLRIEGILKQGYPFSRIGLLEIENTANAGGGVCYSVNDMLFFRKAAQQAQVPVHLDGARIFNALVVLGCSEKQVSLWADSMCFSLNKGLGCPIGSVLLGTKAFIQRAKLARKRLGGSMRQAGYMAATGLYALTHHVSDLEKDHQKAAEVAKALALMPQIQYVMEPQTNMVFFEARRINQQQTIQALEAENIRALGMGDRLVRLVFHRDIPWVHTDELIARLQAIFG